MAVDDNLSSIPGGVASPADPYANNTSTLANTNNVGDIYVSWASVDKNTSIPIAPFNPNRVTVEVSSDGGNNFSPATIAGAGNQATEEDATPALTVSQGRLPTESGLSGDTGITAGQVAVTFDDFGDSLIQPTQLPRVLITRSATRRKKSSRKGPPLHSQLG